MTQALSSSAIQRALRRASNPAYSGSPSGSESPNGRSLPRFLIVLVVRKGSSRTLQPKQFVVSVVGVVRMSTASAAADEAQMDGVTEPNGAPRPTAKLPSKSPIISMSKSHIDEILSVPDHAAFRLKDAEIGTRISSFPLQGGDSLAASPACSLHGSARHSLCSDDPAEADGTGMGEALCAVCECCHLSNALTTG